MAKRSDIRKGFYITYDTPEKVFRGGLLREFDTLRIIILLCGKSFKKIPKGLRRYHLDRLVEIGWLKYVEAQKTYYQVSITKIFPRVTGTKRHWHSMEDLSKDVRAVLYDMDHCYLKEIHVESEASHNRRDESRGGVEKTRQKKMPSKDSRHFGELANSIFMQRYGICMGSASKLRRLCEAAGFGIFTERYRVTKWDTALEGHVMGDKDYLFNGYGGAWVQLASSYTVFNPREMTIDMGRDRNGYARKRKKVDYRDVCNLQESGPYAQ